MKKLLLFLALGFYIQDAFSVPCFRRIPLFRLLLPQQRMIYHGRAPQPEGKEFKERMIDSVFLAGLVGFAVNAVYNKLTNDGQADRIEAKVERLEAKQEEILQVLRQIQLEQVKQGATQGALMRGYGSSAVSPSSRLLGENGPSVIDLKITGPIVKEDSK